MVGPLDAIESNDEHVPGFADRYDEWVLVLNAERCMVFLCSAFFKFRFCSFKHGMDRARIEIGRLVDVIQFPYAPSIGIFPATIQLELSRAFEQSNLVTTTSSF